jgi:hypothetical protein
MYLILTLLFFINAHSATHTITSSENGGLGGVSFGNLVALRPCNDIFRVSFIDGLA